MAKYPLLDLPPLDDQIELRLQARPFFEQAHDMSEDNSYFFPVAHRALQLAAQASFGSPQFVTSTDLGGAAFEAIGYYVEPDTHYDSETAKSLVYTSAMQFIESIKSSEDFIALTDYALRKMEEDTPNLAAMIREIVGRYNQQDKVRTLFSARGAAAMRGMQIFVDKRLEAASAA